MPESEPAEDLAPLARRYEHPTAMLPGALVREVLREASESSELARQLDGMRLIHEALADAAARIAQEGDADGLELNGNVDVVHVCPGFGREPATRVEEAGAIHLRLNVAGSTVLRGVRGRAEGCRFIVESDPPARVEIDSALVLDLGADTRFGGTLRPELLVRLRRLSTAITREGENTVRIERNQYHFRVSDVRIETLLDMSALGLAVLGSAVVIANADGTLSLRERRGEWRCERDGDACRLQR